MTNEDMNDADAADERLWLSAERGPMSSYYALSLIDRTGNHRIGTIFQLAGGGWRWTVGITTRRGERRTETADAASADEAIEQQFDALTRIEPARFARIAA